MPYFVFCIRSFGRFETVGVHDAYKDASTQAKSLRSAPGAPTDTQFKVMFADNEDAAIDLLCQPRTAPPIGDE